MMKGEEIEWKSIKSDVTGWKGITYDFKKGLQRSMLKWITEHKYDKRGWKKMNDNKRGCKKIKEDQKESKIMRKNVRGIKRMRKDQIVW